MIISEVAYNHYINHAITVLFLESLLRNQGSYAIHITVETGKSSRSCGTIWMLGTDREPMAHLAGLHE
jgi:hypothetical protein